MRTRNAARITPAESSHMEAVKNLPCSVCDAPAPSEAHHIEQGLHFCTVALCTDCHRGALNGWHGRRTMWQIAKLDELAALNITLSRIYA